MVFMQMLLGRGVLVHVRDIDFAELPVFKGGKEMAIDDAAVVINAAFVDGSMGQPIVA